MKLRSSFAAALIGLVSRFQPKSNSRSTEFSVELRYLRASPAWTLPSLVGAAREHGGRLDLLVNNASSFYPTPMGEVTEQSWEDLTGTNLKAPLFLSQAAVPALRASQGCIVNITDVHAQHPLKGHPVYCAAKAGLVMLTRSLARELIESE